MLDLVRALCSNPFPLTVYLLLKIMANTWVLIYQLTTLTTIYSSAKISKYNARSANSFKLVIVSRSHVVRKKKHTKSLVIPKIVYKATHLPVTLPAAFMKELNQIKYKIHLGF